MAHTTHYTTDEQRWQAVIQLDKQADGHFFYAVVTTGIYCRPGCASRQPKRENVRYYATQHAAEHDGFRPCKRCAPQESVQPNPAVDAVAKACRLIEEAEQAPSLNQLADAVGLSPYHFHRLFKKTVGITPKQYAMQKRQNRVQDSLQQNTSVTAAIYDAGYESGSRFYEDATTSLGMKPSAYRKGGKGLMIQYAIVESYLGWMLVAVTERGVCRIDFDDAPEALHTRLEATFPQATLQHDESGLADTIGQTLAYLEAPEAGYCLPLDVQGTAFQKRVWTALQAIQPGETASYAEVARQIGNPKASRAVARACASNTIAVAIPCHRVVRSDGTLGGYRWGIDRKRVILDREAGQSTLLA